MNLLHLLAVLGATFLTATTAAAQAQPQAPAPGTAAAIAGIKEPPLVPLEIQVVITRLIDGKAISTLPYTLAVTANSGTAELNMGAEVPVPTSTFTPVGVVPLAAAPAMPGSPAAPSPPSGAPTAVAPRVPVSSASYRPIGTVITCRASTPGDGRFVTQISIDDSAVYSSDRAAPPMPIGATMPVFRSFKARHTVVLSDGQSRQFTVASDRTTGEVVRVDVTLRVVK